MKRHDTKLWFQFLFFLTRSVAKSDTVSVFHFFRARWGTAYDRRFIRRVHRPHRRDDAILSKGHILCGWGRGTTPSARRESHMPPQAPPVDLSPHLERLTSRAMFCPPGGPTRRSSTTTMPVRTISLKRQRFYLSRRVLYLDPRFWSVLKQMCLRQEEGRSILPAWKFYDATRSSSGDAALNSSFATDQ